MTSQGLYRRGWTEDAHRYLKGRQIVPWALQGPAQRGRTTPETHNYPIRRTE